MGIRCPSMKTLRSSRRRRLQPPPPQPPITRRRRPLTKRTLPTPSTIPPIGAASPPPSPPPRDYDSIHSTRRLPEIDSSHCTRRHIIARMEMVQSEDDAVRRTPSGGGGGGKTGIIIGKVRSLSFPHFPASLPHFAELTLSLSQRTEPQVCSTVSRRSRAFRCNISVWYRSTIPR